LGISTIRTVYMGVDPGKSGGIALLFSDRGNIVKVIATHMPDTPKDVFEWIRDAAVIDAKDLLGFKECIAIIEQVGGYTGEGQPGSAMFNFGKGVGHLEMALLACNIPTESVPPRKWQKALGISGKKKTETKTQWKNRLKSVAQRLFPSEKVTLATADALLIATYCKRKHEGTLNG
jgi:hypothetical protein